jgi:oleate hydratase
VRDIEVDLADGRIAATGLTAEDRDGVTRQALTRDDLVFFTNGSMSQNTMMGSTHTVATLSRDTGDRGCFSVWEKLAAQDPRFGNPRTFISDVDKSNWTSFFTTITADPTFYDYMRAKTGDEPGAGGAITVVDSSWKISFVL